MPVIIPFPICSFASTRQTMVEISFSKIKKIALVQILKVSNDGEVTS